MFAKQLSMIVDALREIVPDNKAHVVDSLSSALGNYEQSLEHGGQVTIAGELPRFTRTNSSLQPDPTTLGPIRFDGAMLNINNAPSGDSNKRGENGFAINVGGVSRFDELWGIKWATVDSSGTLGDEDKGYYYYSDGYECGNSSGLTSDVTETPVRVFYTSESAIPATGGKVAYMRDQRGLAYAISGGAGGGTDTVTVVTALQEDAEADELQYKDRAIYATPQAAESDWKTLLDLSGLEGVKFAVLDAALDAGSYCVASVWSGDPLADSGDNVTVYDWFLDTADSLPATTKVAIREIDGKWYLLRHERILRRFELIADLTADNTATAAKLVKLSEGSYVADSGVTFNVYSFTGFTGSIGDRGWCTKKDGRWEVVGGGGGSGGDRVSGVTTDAVDSGDGTFSIESVTAINGTAPEDDPLTVYNVFGWTIDEGGRVNAEWNVTTEHWEAYQAECPA